MPRLNALSLLLGVLVSGCTLDFDGLTATETSTSTTDPSATTTESGSGTETTSSPATGGGGNGGNGGMTTTVEPDTSSSTTSGVVECNAGMGHCIDTPPGFSKPGVFTAGDDGGGCKNQASTVVAMSFAPATCECGGTPATACPTTGTVLHGDGCANQDAYAPSCSSYSPTDQVGMIAATHIAQFCHAPTTLPFPSSAGIGTICREIGANSTCNDGACAPPGANVCIVGNAPCPEGWATAPQHVQLNGFNCDNCKGHKPCDWFNVYGDTECTTAMFTALGDGQCHSVPGAQMAQGTLYSNECGPLPEALDVDEVTVCCKLVP